jgi:hypothetical protein
VRWQDTASGGARDRQIALEHVTPGPGQDSRGPHWRTHLLDRAPRLTGGAVADATRVRDRAGGPVEVELRFDDDGARRFAALTAEQLGGKIAIVVDGTVVAAPVVHGAITGGRVRIRMGGESLASQEAEADLLVEVVESGALPAPIVEAWSVRRGAHPVVAAGVAFTEITYALGAADDPGREVQIDLSALGAGLAAAGDRDVAVWERRWSEPDGARIGVVVRTTSSAADREARYEAVIEERMPGVDARVVDVASVGARRTR